MFPTFLDLGPFEIRAYGVTLALSFILGITLGARRAGRAGLDPELVLGSAWVMVVAGVLGARLVYVFQHLDRFADKPLDALRVWEGGLTLYGGLVAAMICTIWYMTRRTDRSWAYADVLAPFVALGEGITRIGCFLNGCCFGSSCSLPWGVTYPPDSFAAHELGHPHALHPSQLYQSAWGFGIFAFLYWFWRRRRFDGQIFWSYVILEGIGRFITDFARHYEADQLVALGGAQLSDSQLIALLFILVGLVGLGIRRRRGMEQPA